MHFQHFCILIFSLLSRFLVYHHLPCYQLFTTQSLSISISICDEQRTKLTSGTNRQYENISIVSYNGVFSIVEISNVKMTDIQAPSEGPGFSYTLIAAPWCTQITYNILGIERGRDNTGTFLPALRALVMWESCSALWFDLMWAIVKSKHQSHDVIYLHFHMFKMKAADSLRTYLNDVLGIYSTHTFHSQVNIQWQIHTLKKSRFCLMFQTEMLIERQSYVM